MISLLLLVSKFLCASIAQPINAAEAAYQAMYNETRSSCFSWHKISEIQSKLSELSNREQKEEFLNMCLKEFEREKQKFLEDRDFFIRQSDRINQLRNSGRLSMDEADQKMQQIRVDHGLYFERLVKGIRGLTDLINGIKMR